MNETIRDNFAAVGEYLRARFPLSSFVPLSIILAVCAVAVNGHYSGTPGDSFSYILGFSALFLFLLRLRLFDEVKDYEHDSKYYPHRPVQRNVVTIRGIRKAIATILIAESGIALVAGNTDTAILFLVSVAYSILMYKEFFVRDWLRRRFSAYIFLHELLVLPLFAYVASFGGPVIRGIGNEYFILLLLFLGASIFSLEIARKVRDRGNEEAAMDTYSSQYGIAGAALLLFAVLLAAFFSFFRLADISWFWLPAIFALSIPFVAGYAFQVSGLRAKTLFAFTIALVFGMNIFHAVRFLI